MRLIRGTNKQIDEEALPPRKLLVSVCAGLVTVDRQSKTIRLVHYTAQDYFGRHRFSRFPDGDRDIAATCLNYLSFDAFAADYSTSTQNEIEVQVKANPLLNYAATYWGIHAKRALEQGTRTETENVQAGVGKSKIEDRILEYLGQDPNISFAVQVMQDPSWRRQVKAAEYPKKVSSLWVAAAFGLTDIFKLLMDKADVNAKVSNGETALHAAAAYEQEAAVTLLLERGANLNVQDSKGRTALHVAALNGRIEAMQLLLKNGCDISARNHTRKTVLHIAALKGQKAMVGQLAIAQEWLGHRGQNCYRANCATCHSPKEQPCGCDADPTGEQCQDRSQDRSQGRNTEDRPFTLLPRGRKGLSRSCC